MGRGVPPLPPGGGEGERRQPFDPPSPEPRHGESPAETSPLEGEAVGFPWDQPLSAEGSHDSRRGIREKKV